MVFDILFLILCLAGLILSLIGALVGIHSKKNPGKKSFCDINDKISCSKAFNSEYGSLFGLKNSYVGMIFYVLIYVLFFFNIIILVKFLAVFAFIGTFVLAYLLYFKVRSLCLVCTAIYLVNIIIFFLVLFF